MTDMIRVTSTLLLFCLFVGAATTNPYDDDTAAFVQLGMLSKGELAALDDPAKTPLDHQTATMLTANQEIADLLIVAASKPQAAWPDAGGKIQPVLDTLNSVRRAASYLVLQSRYDLSQNHPEKALDDALAIIALARHTGQRNLLIARLVQQSAETMGIDRVAAILPSLPKDLAKTLPDRIAKLPPSADGKTLMAGEFAFAKQSVRAQRGPAGYVDLLDPFYKNIGEAWSLPPTEFSDKVDAEVAKVPLNPFARTIAQGLQRPQEADYVLMARRAMMDTAIDMTITRPDARLKSKDPQGGAPFLSKPTGSGYTLFSKVQHNGQLVSLTVGE